MKARTQPSRHDVRRPDTPGGRRRAGARAVAFLVGACLLLDGRWATCGDPEMARFLLKGAKADLAKKQVDPAFTKLQRAEQEDPTLLEATYWLGHVHELRADPKQAVGAYRRFLAGTAAKVKAGGAPKEEVGLVRKAQERVDALAVSEIELRKLDDALVERLMSFARANLSKDALTVAEAMQIVLELRPDHAEARKMLARVGVVPVAPAGAAPKPGLAPKGPDSASADPADIGAITVWKDLLKAAIFKPNDDWEYRPDGTLTLQLRGGHIRNTTEPLITPPSYALEMRCRVTEPLNAQHALGFAFAFEKDTVRRLYALLVDGDSLSLLRGDGDATSEVYRAPLPATGPDGLHRIGVVVRGQRVEVFAAGKKVAEYPEPLRRGLVGEPGIFVQDCKGEIHAFRLGTVP